MINSKNDPERLEEIFQALIDSQDQYADIEDLPQAEQRDVLRRSTEYVEFMQLDQDPLERHWYRGIITDIVFIWRARCAVC